MSHASVQSVPYGISRVPSDPKRQNSKGALLKYSSSSIQVAGHLKITTRMNLLEIKMDL